MVVQAASALSYLPFLSNGGPHSPFVDPRILSTLMLAAVVITCYTLLRDATPPTVAGPPTNGAVDPTAMLVEPDPPAPTVGTPDRDARATSSDPGRW